MSLVTYSDSESEHGEKGDVQDGPVKKQSRKRKMAHNGSEPLDELPPLPESFHDLYSANPRASTRDDPSLHGGRKRSVPHVEGNWPTHVYLEWHPKPSEFSILANLVDSTRLLAGPDQEIHSLLLSPLSTPLPLHISLSRPLTLQKDQREAFSASLYDRIRRSDVRSFHVPLSGLKWVSNWDKSRWFLVLGAERPAGDELNRLLWASNAIAEGFGLGKLYDGHSAVGIDLATQEKPRLPKRQKSTVLGEKPKDFDRSDCFHFSLAWSLTAPEKMGPLISPEVEKCNRQVKGFSVTISTVKVKIGNAISVLDLSARAPDKERGILGG